jgi:hypothetical protein
VNLKDWDESLHNLGQQLRDIANKVNPGQGSDRYLDELEQEIRNCEQRVHDLAKQTNLQSETADLREKPKLKALFYWVAQYAEKIETLMTASSRVSMKEHWLQLFRHRFSSPSNAKVSGKEWLDVLQHHKKLKDVSQYLDHQATDLQSEIGKLNQTLTKFDTENFNNSAVACMQCDSEEIHSVELNGIHHLERFLRMVAFLSIRSASYQQQTIKEIATIDHKLSQIINNCRELALDTLDFDSDSEKIIRKKKFAEYQDQVDLLKLKLEKILGFLESSRPKILHPVLKKSPKKANNTSARKYRPTSLSELG